MDVNAADTLVASARPLSVPDRSRRRRVLPDEANPNRYSAGANCDCLTVALKLEVIELRCLRSVKYQFVVLGSAEAGAA